MEVSSYTVRLVPRLEGIALQECVFVSDELATRKIMCVRLTYFCLKDAFAAVQHEHMLVAEHAQFSVAL